MHPDLDGPLPTGSLALSDLVLVVREPQIHAASVNIELLAQVFRCHSGALDMPTGKTNAPRAGPVHLPACIAMFPQREIFWSILILGNLHLLSPVSTLPQVFYGIPR